MRSSFAANCRRYGCPHLFDWLCVALACASWSTVASAQSPAPSAPADQVPSESSPPDAPPTAGGSSVGAEHSASVGASVSIGTPPPEPEPAPPPPPPRQRAVYAEFGGRLGYAKPFGELEDGWGMGRYFSGMIPMIGEIGIRLRGGLSFTAFGQIGIGLDGSALKNCSRCSAADFQIGLSVTQHFNSRGGVDPWVGGAIGYEIMTLTVPTGDSIYDYYYRYSYHAIPQVTAQAGLDLGGEAFALGPYLGFSLASFTSGSRDLSCTYCAGSYDEGDFDVNAALHGWLQIGIHGAYLR